MSFRCDKNERATGSCRSRLVHPLQCMCCRLSHTCDNKLVIAFSLADRQYTDLHKHMKEKMFFACANREIMLSFLVRVNRSHRRCFPWQSAKSVRKILFSAEKSASHVPRYPVVPLLLSNLTYVMLKLLSMAHLRQCMFAPGAFVQV